MTDSRVSIGAASDVDVVHPPPLTPKREFPARPPKQAMTKWFSPTQLAGDAANIIVSYALRDRNDFRLLEANVTAETEFHDHSRPAKMHGSDETSEEDLWVDYVADVGDGWDSTYSIACLLTQDLVPGDVDGATTQKLRAQPARTNVPNDDSVLKRGRVLIMGGDEVYASATRRAYDRRLVVPYLEACGVDSRLRHLRARHEEEPEPTRTLYAIPGNHDWYDGLTSFTRLFCQKRTVADWKTAQSRSYVALRLPGKWWLFAVDIHLTADIDKPQLDYFKDIAARLEPGSQIILCVAEPEWLKGDPASRRVLGRAQTNPLAQQQESDPFQQNITFFEEEIREAARGSAGDISFRVRIAGDYHHYQRHTSTATVDRLSGVRKATPDDERCHNIVAGGGGAFLHPTHNAPKEIALGRELATVYSRAPSGKDLAFPTAAKSRALLLTRLWLGLAFPLWNFSSLLVFIPLAAIALGATLAGPSPTIGAAIGLLLSLCALAPPKGFSGLVLGTVHFGLQCGALSLAWLLLRAFSPASDSTQDSLRTAVAFWPSAVIGGALMATAFGLFLAIANSLWCVHDNEAFAAFRYEGFKNFLRLHVRPDGSLTIYAIGLRTCPTDWAPNHDLNAPRWKPRSGDLAPEVIDKIEIRAPITPARQPRGS